ncbi:helix-turn-helix domain-containing protein [Ectobacillus panaciterrae]
MFHCYTKAHTDLFVLNTIAEYTGLSKSTVSRLLKQL